MFEDQDLQLVARLRPRTDLVCREAVELVCDCLEGVLSELYEAGYRSWRRTYGSRQRRSGLLPMQLQLQPSLSRPLCFASSG